MGKQMKIQENKAITLIALIITILILIILAGIAINLTLGQNGILNKIKYGKNQYQIAAAKEKLQLKIAEVQIEKEGHATLEDLKDTLNNDEEYWTISLEELTQVAALTKEVTIGKVENIYIVSNKIYEFQVGKDLNINKFVGIVEEQKIEKISFKNLTWNEGKASIEMNSKENEIIQYQINRTDGIWKKRK